MIDNPFGKTSQWIIPTQKKEEPKKPIIVPIDTKVPESLVPIPEEPIKEEIKKEPSYSEKVLAEHNGLESNIPINHEYWKKRP